MTCLHARIAQNFRNKNQWDVSIRQQHAAVLRQPILLGLRMVWKLEVLDCRFASLESPRCYHNQLTLWQDLSSSSAQAFRPNRYAILSRRSFLSVGETITFIVPFPLQQTMANVVGSLEMESTCFCSEILEKVRLWSHGFFYLRIGHNVTFE
jgi:hypothetical protein